MLILFLIIPFIFVLRKRTGFLVAILAIGQDFIKILLSLLGVSDVAKSSIATLGVGFVLLVVVVYNFHKRPHRSLPINEPRNILLVFFTLLFAALMFFMSKDSPYQYWGLQKSIQFSVSAIPFLTLPLLLLSKEEDFKDLLIGFIIIGASLSILVWFLKFQQGEVLYQGFRGIRTAGTPGIDLSGVNIDSAIWLARKVGILVLASIFFFQDKKFWVKLVKWSLIFFGLTTIAYTGSRAPLLSLVVALILTAGAMKKKVLLILTGSFILFLLMIPGDVTDRIFGLVHDLSGLSLSDRGAMERVGYANEAMAMFLSNPLYGIGTGGFGFWPHNIFLEIASELGLVGLILIGYYTFILFKIWYFAFKIKITNSFLSYIKFALVFVVYAFLNSLSSGNLGSNEYVWLSGGILGSAYFVMKRKLLSDGLIS